MFERCGLPRLAAFGPKLIFLSCGFDGIAGDPTEAETRLTPPWYARVASACVAHAPVVATLQGGYLAGAVAQAGQGVVTALAGADQALTPVLASGDAVVKLVEGIEAILENSDMWWPVEQSFNHGLLDSDDDEGEDAGTPAEHENAR